MGNLALDPTAEWQVAKASIYGDTASSARQYKRSQHMVRLCYGGGGMASVELVSNGKRPGIRAVFTDEGPGIPNIDLALTDGWTSGTGLGLGMSGARRLVDEFDVETAVGRGTTVSIVKWAR